MLSLAVLRPMSAQTFDMDKERVPIAVLDGLWRFHTGDDPRWADPVFDDSKWPLLRSDRPWNVQGYKDLSGFAWYRFQVIVPAKHGPLGILIPGINNIYEIYANGRLIGSRGAMPPHLFRAVASNQVHAVPVDPVNSAKQIQFSIRVWVPRRVAMFSGGGPNAAVRFGDLDQLEDSRSGILKRLFWRNSSSNFLVLIGLIAGAAGFLLFLQHRADREYLWFGTYEFLVATSTAVNLLPDFYPIGFHGWLFWQQSSGFAATLCFALFLFNVLPERRSTLYSVVILSVAGNELVLIAHDMEWISVGLSYTLHPIITMPYYVALLVLLVRNTARGNREAKLLLGPVALSYFNWMLYDAIFAYEAAGHPRFRIEHLRWLFYLTEWPFPISTENVTDALMQLSVLVILLMRFVRTRRDEQRMATELESARMVQSVLIPSETPEVPGFSIASVYIPAMQVGGDLFQIIPNGNGGVLVVIGDVSGKGIPAAMTVSLLVGTVRTLAHYTQSPGEILSAMNNRMLSRSAGGFTTCLVLRADSDGALTVANAGHIAPYLNGAELQPHNGLPLGVNATSTYLESTFRLAPHEQLTLMTDGVVEARSNEGELYGFERTAAIASNSAESIALAAQQFGQEDDITVVTLVRQSASVDMPQSTPSLSALPGT